MATILTYRVFIKCSDNIKDEKGFINLISELCMEKGIQTPPTLKAKKVIIDLYSRGIQDYFEINEDVRVEDDEESDMVFKHMPMYIKFIHAKKVMDELDDVPEVKDIKILCALAYVVDTNRFFSVQT